MIDLFEQRNGYPSVADLIEVNDCWEWKGAPSNTGYGRIKIDGTSHAAMRVVWEALVGSTPEGLEPDHLCRNRMCVNPDHIEWVTHKVNVRRGARTRHNHCQCGEIYHVASSGQKKCRPCHARYMREHRPSRSLK